MRNELGQAVSISQFNGQALAITFFFTRCPIPDYCPRLSKNFAEASRKLSAMPDAATNWHFLSGTFDPEFDTPAVLKGYGDRYHYDPTHWSFLTGAADKIAELAHLSDVTFEREGGLFNHNFRTLIINAAGRLQMSYPIGGESVRVFKPDPRVYRLAAETLRVEPGEISFQTSNAWDGIGAAAVGFRFVWINRLEQPPEKLPFQPDVELKSLSGLPVPDE